MSWKNDRYTTLLCLAFGTAGIWLGASRFQPSSLPRLSIEAPRSDRTANSNQQPATAAIEVVAFLSTSCPISNSYVPELIRLSAKCKTAGVTFLGVVPGNHLSGDDVARYQRDYGIPFVLVHDPHGRLVQQYDATHTPQVVVLAGGRIVYSGRIDNTYADLGVKRSQTTCFELRDVLSSLLSGRSVQPRTVQAVGCVIESNKQSARSGTAVTFAEHVAPILFQHCSRCHRPGEAAPFSLLGYDDAVAHAEQIRTVVERRLMPPWKAEPNFGSFSNEHRLTDDQIDTINQWVKSGAAPGDPATLPPRPQFVDGWQLGRPDVELIMPEPFSVPADGPDIYRHFVIPTTIKQNCLIAGVEFRPGQPQVVHHAFMYYDTTGTGRKLDASDPGPGYSRIGTPGFPVSGSLGGWGPGGLPRRLPDRLGIPLNGNADLVVQIHYHPSGRAVADQSRIGLHFARSATHWVTEILVSEVDLVIPAGAERHHHSASYTLPVDTLVLDATPHMHTVGRELKVVAELPDGSSRPMIWIKNWDFNWQESYVYEQPVSLPAGTRLKLDCWFDNSSNNPLNPNAPPQQIRWGDFSTDEMGICYFQVTTANREDFIALKQHAGAYFSEQWKRYQATRK